MLFLQNWATFIRYECMLNKLVGYSTAHVHVQYMNNIVLCIALLMYCKQCKVQCIEIPRSVCLGIGTREQMSQQRIRYAIAKTRD